VRLRLTGTSDGQPDLRGRMLALLPALRERIGSYIFAEEDSPLEVVIGQILQAKNWQLGTAESCTGGAVAARITSVPGSSAYFRGSVVAYDNDLKESLLGVNAETLGQHGAVSEPTVREMAEGARARLGCDVALATSGIAGPGGGTPLKPVGTICIACATPAGTVSRQINIDRGRQTNIEYTTQAVLILLWQQLAGHREAELLKV
jgi:nicotinamide-nucleotide amidase